MIHVSEAVPEAQNAQERWPSYHNPVPVAVPEAQNTKERCPS